LTTLPPDIFNILATNKAEFLEKIGAMIDHQAKELGHILSPEARAYGIQRV